jgi:hypothetical protein
MLFALSGIGLAALSGCEKLSFMPQPRQHVVAGYDAVKTGMTEGQVYQHLGPPTRRSGYDLEGTPQRATALTYVGGGKLITITLIGGAVAGKQRY